VVVGALKKHSSFLSVRFDCSSPCPLRRDIVNLQTDELSEQAVVVEVLLAEQSFEGSDRYYT
jgi:hypothetical protein